MLRKKIYLDIIYLSLLIYILFSIIFLFYKSTIPHDFSMSEMLVNYNGGFSSRGFNGHIFYLISNFAKINIINVVLFFQIIFVILFVYLIYKLISQIKFKINLIDLVILLSPIALFFPIYEYEALGRNEILILISFIYLILLDDKPNTKIIFSYSFIVLPFLILNWEVSLLYFPFFFMVFFLKFKINNIKFLFRISLIFLPSLIIMFFIYQNPLTQEKLDLMCNTIPCFARLNETYNFDLDFIKFFDWVHGRTTLINYLRYFLILILSYLPFYFLINLNDKFTHDFYLLKIFRNYIYLLIFLSLPQIIIFLYALDWSRYLNISIMMSYFFILFLRKSNLLNEIKDISLEKNKKFFLKFLIIIYLFFWYPKLTLWDDIGSFPILRSLNRLKDIVF